MTSRTFTRQQLEELDAPYTNLHDEQVDTLRWSEIRSCVFRTEDGTAYRVTYQRPLTEHQDCDRWFDEDQIGATEVEQRPVVTQQWTAVDTPRDKGLDALLPAWEAMYEPGNVSDYLIGYANDECAAKAAAEAWMRSQSEVTGRLEWTEMQLRDGDEYDRWFDLVQRHDDGVDTGPGITVRRRARSGEGDKALREFRGSGPDRRDVLLRDTEAHLSALHGSVARHDNLAANLACSGCELRDRIRSALAAASV